MALGRKFRRTVLAAVAVPLVAGGLTLAANKLRERRPDSRLVGPLEKVSSVLRRFG